VVEGGVGVHGGGVVVDIIEDSRCHQVLSGVAGGGVGGCGGGANGGKGGAHGVVDRGWGEMNARTRSDGRARVHAGQRLLCVRWPDPTV
jgi:hypothetical protein